MIGKFIKTLERFLADKNYTSIELNRKDAAALLSALRGENIEKEKHEPKEIKIAKRRGRLRTKIRHTKKPRTYKQKRADLKRKDDITDAIEKGTNHILGMIDNQYMTAQEFLNDPSVYYDSQVMGKYKNIPIVTNAIETAVFAKYFF